VREKERGKEKASEMESKEDTEIERRGRDEREGQGVRE